ncbi:hypothetical protein ACFQRC_03980 [Enterovirga sp. GCM10030262]|uniref:hypothetical protein n=1 Tax=Enterovirga sp. GCM10030262 TaxID=3273391 RepID=UPI00361436FC
MMLGLLLLLVQATERAPAASPMLIVPDAEFAVSIGHCSAADRSFDMDRVWFLEDRAAHIDSPTGLLRMSIDRDNLVIEEMRGNSMGTKHISNIGHMLAEGGIKPDLRLKLGVLDRDLVVYWRETYENRVYRQGLLSVEGKEPVPLCEGKGGLNYSH